MFFNTPLLAAGLPHSSLSPGGRGPALLNRVPFGKFNRVKVRGYKKGYFLVIPRQLAAGSFIVAISMLILFVSGFLLGPDRRWVSPLKDSKPLSDSTNE